MKQQQIERPPEATNLAAGGQGELPKDFGLEAGFSSGQLLNAARLREAAVENVGRAASFAMIEIMKSSMPACRPIWKWVVRHVSRPLVFALLLLAPAVGLSAAEFQIE